MNFNNNDSRLLTAKDVAAILGITDKTAWRYMKDGHIRCTSVGNKKKRRFTTRLNLSKFTAGGLA